MSDVKEAIGVESLLAAAIVASGGVLIIRSDDLTSPEILGKFIGLDLNPDNTITMRLVDYDNNIE